VVLLADPRIPSRLDHLAGRGPSPVPALRCAAQQLEAAGATVVALPSSTTHAYYDDIAACVGVPLLHLPTVILKAVAARGWRTVGLMATTPTVRLYHRWAGDYAVRLQCPDPGTQDDLMTLVNQVKLGAGLERAGSGLETLRMRPWSRDVDGVILGCTELPVVYPRKARSRSLVDATDELARAALRARGRIQRAPER
jgi:aspartate racemase